MKDRILLIMKQEHMTQQEFARAIDVSPASLSNIFNGKTNPTINHVYAILKSFPAIDIEWLISGEGSMNKKVADATETASNSPFNDPDNETAYGSLFQEAQVPSDPLQTNEMPAERVPGAAITLKDDMKVAQPIVREVVKYIDKPQRQITEIRIFFDDGTFEVFSPK